VSKIEKIITGLVVGINLLFVVVTILLATMFLSSMKSVDYKITFRSFADKQLARKRQQLAEKLERQTTLVNKTFHEFINNICSSAFMTRLYEKYCSADVSLINHITERPYFESEVLDLIKQKFKSEGWKILSVTTENPDSMDNQGNVVFTIELPSGFWEGVEKP